MKLKIDESPAAAPDKVEPVTTRKGGTIFETRGLQGKEQLVERVKTKAGELWDLFHEGTNTPGTEGGRMYALAKTNLEQAVMWFVKGISRSE